MKTNCTTRIGKKKIMLNKNINPDDICAGAMLVEMRQKNVPLSRKLSNTERQVTLAPAAQQVWNRGDAPVIKNSKYFFDPFYYREIQEHQSETIRQLQYYTGGNMWSKGVHIMATEMMVGDPSLGRDPFMAWKNTRIQELEVLTHNFIGLLPQAIQEAKMASPVFQQSDYLNPIHKYRDLVQLSIETSPIASGSDYRINLDKSELEKLKQSHEQQLVSKTRGVVIHLVDQLVRNTKNMKERLDKGERFHTSSIQTLHRLAKTAPLMDVTKNQDLAEICSRIVSELTGYGMTDKDSYKSDAERVEGATQAGQITKDLEAFADIF